MENVREALGTPGSWYLDRPTGMLTYCPMPGETPESAVVITPVTDRLLEFRGDAAAGRLVEQVRLEGLSFAHCNWSMPQGGQSYPQAEANVGGAIMATGARHLAFDCCAVRHVGRYAFEFRAGCQDCSLARCELVDLGGGGVLASSEVHQMADGNAGSPTTIFTTSATVCSPKWGAFTRSASRPARSWRAT